MEGADGMEVLNIVLKAAGAFMICFIVVYLIARVCFLFRMKKDKPRRVKQASQGAEEKKFPLNKMDIILITMGVALLAFTLKMINLFETYMSVPDTLITCVFAICGGECGAMSWIKTANEKYRERKWKLEDEKRMEDAAQTVASDPTEQKGGTT